jgi:methyltransferase (TIGR00027 family)
MLVAEWRHIQSVHEETELRNPDTLVRHFLPALQRWRCTWLSQSKLASLRTDPFYYYLIARTKYYDELFLEAIDDDVQYIINVGCGSDTRSHRFHHALKQKGVRVLESDRPEAISRKQRLARRHGSVEHVAYLSIDLNDDAWPEFEQWLATTSIAKALVLMEGVSPYVNSSTFGGFLSLLARKLPSGSRVAYDFKLRGVADDFGRVGTTREPFRLTAGIDAVAGYHEAFGYRLDHMEQSSELTTRLLSGQARSGALFSEDALIQLRTGLA